MELVIASRSLGKIREFREMLGEILGLDVNSLLAFPNYSAPEETGKSFRENAELKALDAAKQLGKLVLADDSGLVVPILGGEPGVHSKRYSGDQATDRDNRKKLLEALQGKNDLERQAYFECCLALASPEGIIKVTTGRVEGVIVNEERGRYGFGYDSIFMKHDYDKTFGELKDDVKNRISHRRKALDAMLPAIESRLQKTR